MDVKPLTDAEQTELQRQYRSPDRQRRLDDLDALTRAYDRQRACYGRGTFARLIWLAAVLGVAAAMAWAVWASP